MHEPDARITVMQDASEQGAWRIASLSPGAALAALVPKISVYEERHAAPLRRREPPNGLATLIINLGDPLGVEHPVGTPAIFPAGSGFYTGLSATYAVTESGGSQSGAQAMLTPLGARRLLGFPLAEAGDRLIDPVDLFGAEAREAIERLREANREDHRLAILEQAMARRLARSAPDVPRDLVWAMRRLRASGGRVGIAALAADLGCSRKHLTTRFGREFGMPPKRLAGVLRFARAVALLRAGAITTWADLAQQCGYADQPHLARDFRAFAGRPPAAFAASIVPGGGGFLD